MYVSETPQERLNVSETYMTEKAQHIVVRRQTVASVPPYCGGQLRHSSLGDCRQQAPEGSALGVDGGAKPTGTYLRRVSER